jgi:hypothetical protein
VQTSSSATTRRIDWQYLALDVGPRALQTALIVLSVVQFLRCVGAAYVWLYVGLIVPSLRFALSATYRRDVLDGVWNAYHTIEAFAADHRRPLPWRAVGLLVFLPAGLFYLSNPRPIMTGDSKPITLIASSLVRNGSTDVGAYASHYAPFYHFPGQPDLPYFFIKTTDGIHSSYPSGMCLFALPSAAAARLLAVDLSRGGVQDHMEKDVASWLAAACVGLFFLIALHLTDARSAGLTTLLLTVGSGVCSTVGQALWQHGGVIFWMLLALLIEFRTWRQPTWRGTILQGVALSMMFACRLASALSVAAFGLWLLLRAPRRAFFVGLAAVVAYLPWMCYYQAVYGTPFGPSIQQLSSFTGEWRDTLVLLLVSLDHGLLVYQPWILLLAALAVPRVRRRLLATASDAPAGWYWFCLLAIVPTLGLVASWNCWWGGDCWGSRLVIETVPFFALLCLPCVSALRQLAWGRGVLAATLVLAAFLHLTGVYLKVDIRASQPLIGANQVSPGSPAIVPFLTPFVGSLHIYR